MSSINGVNGSYPLSSPLVKPGRVSANAESGVSASRSDRVELSGVNQFLQILKTNDVRAEKVASVKAAIESGRYDDDAKLDIAVDRLLDDLNL